MPLRRPGSRPGPTSLHGPISSTVTPFGNLIEVNQESQERAEGPGAEPDVEASPPTRELKRGRTANTDARSGSIGGPDTNGGSAARSGTSFKLSGEALLNEERGRLRVTAQVMMGVACLGLLLAPVMGGDPFAKKVFIAGLASAVLTMAVLLRNSYVSNYNINAIGVGGVSLALAYACTLYYIGSASQAAMTGALGLYIFCLGGSAAWSAAVYAALALPHLVLATLIMLRLVPDRGLVTVSALPLTDQIALQGCVQAVYAIALLAGRRSRRKLERVFGDLESAARLIAQRDALLNEAKRDLERAVRVGGEGRFTDQVVGSFRLGNIIGRGGMGEVYDAVHLTTSEPAAVKLLARNVVSDPNSVARFAREVKAASAFDSPYVVRVLEVPDENSAVPYLAMERLRGEDLASMLRREERLPSRELVEIAEQVGRGLDEARAAGVIHRDIKPQNLFLARRDGASPQWKVLDFGVSKLLGHGTLTDNQLVGTPDYMAPEQAADDAVDHRADLYGLAAVLYRCVVSRAPFVENSLAVLLHKVINKMPPRPSSLARVSSDIEAFFAIGLCKAPADRFDSGVELAEAFRLATTGNLPSSLRTRAERILERTPWAER
jgi:hypothetical protein